MKIIKTIISILKKVASFRATVIALGAVGVGLIINSLMQILPPVFGGILGLIVGILLVMFAVGVYRKWF